jgi:hypothetical protein
MKIIKEKADLIIMFLLFICLGISAKSVNDDLVYWSRQSLNIEVIKERLQIQSARVLNEIPLVIYSSKFWLFQCLLPIMCLLTVIMTIKIFVPNADKKTRIACIVLFSTSDLMVLSEAGWAATASNYTFAYPIFLIGMSGFVKIIHNRKFQWYEFIIYPVALLFGTNQEQLAVIGSFTSIMLLIYSVCYRKQRSILLLLLGLIPIVSLVWFIAAPSAGARGIFETRWFIDYKMLTIPRKLLLGFQHAASALFYRYNALFAVVCAFIFIRVIQIRKNILPRIIASIPLLITLEFGMKFFVSGWGLIERLIDNGTFPANVVESPLTYNSGMINVLNFQYLISYITYIIAVIGVICFMMSIYNAFEEYHNRLIALWCFCMALISSFILGFSPSVWASGQRTNYFMNMLIMAIGVMTYEKIKNKKCANIILFIALIFAFHSYFKVLLCNDV